MSRLQDYINKIKDRISDEKQRKSSELCKMGDVVAMYDMAMCFYQKCSIKLRINLKKYELNPCEQTKNELETQMRSEDDLGIIANYYMMWILRAAMYGNKKAENLLDKCDLYKERAYLTNKAYTKICSIWSSDSLYNGGFYDVSRGNEDCRLIPNVKAGYFELMYCSYYCSSDSSGFGSEMEFSSEYYDEFFMRIDVKSEAPEEEILAALKKNEEIRAVYWNAHKDATERKYQKRL